VAERITVTWARPLIRSAIPDDADALVGLIEDLGYPLKLDDARSRLTRLLATPDSGAFVAERSGKVVGLAAFHIFELIYRPRPDCRLNALVVRSDHRRQRIGTSLVQAVEELAHERGCHRLELTTRPDRPEAVEFYVGLGFSERPHRLVKPLDAEGSPQRNFR
jgi:GNAT superfamily N-acetyltransferase